LHYIKNNSKLNKGDLVLIDAGCEYNHYASDITRTFPIGGSFSAPQRDVYEIVLAAQKKAIDQVKKNNRFDDPHKSAVEVLSQGLIDLKVLKKSISEIVEKKLYAKFFMHRTSHWMGMDVHDVGNYFTANSGSAVLSDGQVLTIEPGLYFADNASVPKAFRGIGIRIEDDVLVSGKEAEILTSDCPKEISALESIIGKS
jgi:Xaa-Pro aminopeptidase